MKLKTAAALAAPLIAGFVAGCDTPAADFPANFKNPPQVVAVYAVDQVGSNVCDPLNNCEPGLPDVLVYSKTESGKTSPAPPSYGGFRVEFDQPMDGTSIANNNDLSGQSFCTVKTAGGTGAASIVSLVDLTGSASASLPSSVCYNPTSNLGQHPSVLVILGSGAAFAAAGDPSPFTCRDFNNETGGTNGLAMKANAQYGITIDKSVKSSNGLTLNPDASNTAIKFNTSGFDIMAAGIQDANTGYFTWLDKPFKGFEKDLDPVGAGTFVKAADGNPFLIVLTESPKNPEVVTAARADPAASDFGAGSNLTYDPSGLTFLKTFSDPRVITVNAGDTFEPGVSYNVTVPATLTALDGEPLPAASVHTYKFTADPTAPLAIVGEAPTNGATEVSLDPANFDPLGVDVGIVVDFPVPIDPTSLGGITVTPTAGPGAGAALTLPASAFTVEPGFNNQRLYILPPTPTGANTPFVPGTTYKVNVTGVKADPATPKETAGKAITPFSFQFVTTNFAIDRLTHSTAVCATGGCPYSSAGFNPSGRIDRRTDVVIEALVDNNLKIRFLDTANNVTNSTIHLFEVNASTGAATPIPTDPTQVSVTATAGGNLGDGGRFRVKITDPTYVLKFGQLYRLQADSEITDSDTNAAGAPVKATGCTAAKCPDTRTFTTKRFIPSISTPRDATTHDRKTFKVSFPYPVDPSSVSDLVTGFKLYQQDSAGKLTPFAGGVTCALDVATNKVITCTPGAALAANTTYLASAIFTSANPAVVAAKIPNPSAAGTFFPNPADQAKSGRFVGSLSRTFTTNCP